MDQSTRIQPDENSSTPELETPLAREARELAQAVLPHLARAAGQIRILCTAADADAFVAPFLAELEKVEGAARLKLVCSWNQPVKFGEVSLSIASRTYSEPFQESPADTLLLVQSALFDDTQDAVPHLQGVSTAKTNISHALGNAMPDTIIVASAVSGVDAFEQLRCEFPAHMLDRLVPVTLHTVSVPPNNLTFTEFRDVPALVRERRAQYFPR